MNRKSFIQSFQELNGSAEELTQAATTLCDFLGLHFDSDSMEVMEPGSEPESEGNERLLRHYVSVNVVDKPARQGREVRYGFRHLLQYATARRLLKQGFSLAKIAQYTSVLTTNDLLNALLSKSQQSEAELLVAAYKSNVKPPHASATSSPRMSMSKQKHIDPIHGMADLLKEIEQMRYRFSKEMDDMRRISDSLDDLNAIIDQSARHGLKAQNEFMEIVHRILQTVEETKYEVAKRTAEVAEKVEVSQFEVAVRIDRLEKKMDTLENKIHIYMKQRG